jgi:hypothetical protein
MIKNKPKYKNFFNLFLKLFRSCVIVTIGILISGCAEFNLRTVVPTSTPDPMQSGYDLLGHVKPFLELTTILSDHIFTDTVKIKENLPELTTIADATSQLVVTSAYINAKLFTLQWMSSDISLYNLILKNQPRESINHEMGQSIYYFDLFIAELRSLGHQLRTE